MHWHKAVHQEASRGQPYVIATVIATKGSAPRPAGTKMVITPTAEHDTLGGGQLEHLVIARARELLEKSTSGQHIEHFPLAAAALQCCGGSVTVLLECFTHPALRIAVFGGGHIGERVVMLTEQLNARVSWFEPLDRTPEGDLATSLRETELTKFTDPETVVAGLETNTQIIIVSHDHQLDYALLEAILTRGLHNFAGVGMIGSTTKWQRFRKRLIDAGFDDQEVTQIRCPLGMDAATDKQPMAIAIAIVNELLNLAGQRQQATMDQALPALSWRQIKSALVQEP